MRRLLVVRPQPGADRTKARAAELGWHVVAAPIFTIVPVDWDVPASADFDALMLTSANAVRQAGPGLASLARLPVFAVGGETARAATAAGFADVHVGTGDVAALSEAIAAAGVRRVLHLAGRDRHGPDHAALQIEHRTVYAAEAVDTLPEAAASALAQDAILLLHSPRAGKVLTRLLAAADSMSAAIRIAAISAAAAAGEWKERAIADAPTDAALLAAAARLCEKP